MNEGNEILKDLHEHMIGELPQSARTDAVFVVTAVLSNLVALGVNSAVASAGKNGPQNDAILAVLIVATLLINGFAVRALLTGRDTRAKLLSGLVAMYMDNEVDKYYDAGLLDAYGTRYRMFVAVLVCLAAISIVVPRLSRFLG